MNLDMITPVFLGISLSAACGLRALIPVLVFGVAVAAGHISPSSGFAWIGSSAALAAFAALAGAELFASFTEKAGRLFDLAATPIAMLVGSLLAMAAFRDVDVLVGTLVPLIIGVGIAGPSQSLVGLMRARFVAASGRKGRAVAGLAEASGALLLAALGVLAPLAGGVLVLALLAARWNDVREAVRR